ncbi:Canalicular multispecific organic anion transporter 1 [Halocaridina rubra]|uniref:Canalicular multispecific organic anion transporter 1 n=1 Tax=Halocaridina rubra TaxID=373956 RepID=A0AAN8XI53_HALRR
MSEEYLLDDFCGGPFWDYNLTWNTTFPDFTPCFERTVLLWVPCAYLWVFAALEVGYLKRSLDRLVPWSWVNISKMIVSLLVLVLVAIDFFYAVQRSSSGEEVFGVDYAAPAILFFTVFLQLIFVFFEKKRGIQSSGYLFLFWLMLVLCSIPEYRTWFINISDDPDSTDTVGFVLYMIYFPLIVVMLVLNCFADATPEYVHFSRGERPCPETSASYFSRIMFAWLDPLIWRGYRQPLEQKNLWNLSYENASHYVVSVWDNHYKKYMAKNEKKTSTNTWADQTNNANHIEMSEKTENTSKKKVKISILPTMLRTYGPAFSFGAFLKLIYDLLQFVSPLILSSLISFTENVNGNEPEWHGYFYASIMFASAQLQSFILGQYFMKMFLVGLRIRTGVISAVYRKALKISNSARKESTVGEIVNLMSVDAQRFMDLTTYLNMIWSAPLQIALCLVLLFRQLGPSVLAGLGVLIVLIPVNGFIANKTKILQISQMKCKDKRVKLMNEILNGIKVKSCCIIMN